MINIDLNINTFLLIILAILFFMLVLVIVIFVLILMRKNNDKNINKSLYEIETSIIKENNEFFVKILRQNDNSYIKMNNEMVNSLDKIRMATDNKLNIIEYNINQKLDVSLNERLDSSFKVIGEQLLSLEETNGRLLTMSNTMDDLQKTFASVKHRGIFGEKQLENILDNILTKNMYETQFNIKEDDSTKVDFAVKIPNKAGLSYIYLPIDAKFPNDKYLNVINASTTNDETIIYKATKELATAVLEQAKSISEKYIDVPKTTEFAIMFLPSEGLYSECLRINGLLDKCIDSYRVLLAGPVTITAIINSFSVGFKFLQINENSREIAKTLQNIKMQYEKFSTEIDKAKNSIEMAKEQTEQLKKRNDLILGKLKKFDVIENIKNENLIEQDV